MSISKLTLKVIGAAGLFSFLVLATGAQAAPVLFSIGYAAAQDIGTTSAISKFAPFTSSTFPHTPFNATSDPDKGCDADAFANFGGPGAGPAGIPTCGDTLIVNGASGTTGAGTGMLTAPS
jgi:hypothetical protein